MQRFAQHCCFTSGIVMLLVLPFARSSCCATVLCQQLVAQQFVQLITTKYSTVGRQIARATVETSSIAMWHKKPLRPNSLLFSWFSSARSVKNCYILVLLEVHEAYVSACTLLTVFLLLLFTGPYIKMLCFVSKQGIFNCLCVNVFFLRISRFDFLQSASARTRSL